MMKETMMWDNYVGRQIRRCNINLATAAFGALLAAVVGVLVLHPWRVESATWGFIAGGATVTAFILGVRALSTWLSRRRGPAEHPAVRELARYGEPARLAQQISREVTEAGDEIIRVGCNKLTESWLLEEDMFGFHATPFSNIVWVYEKSTKHYTNFIPTGTTHELMIRTALGTERTVSGIGDRDVKYIMTQIKVQNPRVVAGYNEQLDSYWKNDPAGTARGLAKEREDPDTDREPR